MAERCQHMAEKGVQFLPRLPPQDPCQRSTLAIIPPVGLLPHWSCRRQVLAPRGRVTGWSARRGGVGVIRANDFRPAYLGRRAFRTLRGRLRAIVAILGYAWSARQLADDRSAEPEYAWVETLNTGKPDQPKSSDGYIIGSGDQLSVFVWKTTIFAKAAWACARRADLRPLIEDIQAAGKTPTARPRYRGTAKKYVQDPLVTVIVRSFVGPSTARSAWSARRSTRRRSPTGQHDRPRRDDRDQGADEIRRRQRCGDRRGADTTAASITPG